MLILLVLTVYCSVFILAFDQVSTLTAGRVVDIDLEKCVISPVKVAFKQC
jgi:hypothetical protein